MEGDYKIVDFVKWCRNCKYYKTFSTDEPCDECLTHGARKDSRKPEKWEAAE